MVLISGQNDGGAGGRQGFIATIANTFDWLITAFVLAFVFRAFVMEAFRIPTGSMADTLKGAHFRLCCPQCGYRYDYNFADQSPGYDSTAVPSCPSCRYLLPAQFLKTPVSNGDRILVLKCIYQFREPSRWDVIVFKNPREPRVNYIKRLIGKPYETVEIIDGDICIDGKIARKPAKVQEELWMPVYDNDYQPVRPEQRRFNGHYWQQPFRNLPGSQWNLNAAGPTIFALDSTDGKRHSIYYDSDWGSDFTATYAYDDNPTNANQPYCSDLMARFYVTSTQPEGSIGIGLSKYGVRYSGWVNLSGSMFIARVDSTDPDAEPAQLAFKEIAAPDLDRPMLVRFANVDHQLIFQLGREQLTYDLGREPADAGTIREDVQPQVTIFGSGRAAISHIAIFRDIYYTIGSGAGKLAHAAQGNPFTLGADEFFVLGDNSPASYDSRFWFGDGIGNNNRSYRPGIVPRDYLVGKAVFVYWPSGFRPMRSFPFALVPNVGQMRFIYGGSG
jgi:signal peptidase I